MGETYPNHFRDQVLINLTILDNKISKLLGSEELKSVLLIRSPFLIELDNIVDGAKGKHEFDFRAKEIKSFYAKK